MKRFLFSVICTLLAFAGFAQEQIAIKHGPYLQNLKETETTIVWVANKASVGWKWHPMMVQAITALNVPGFLILRMG